MGRPARLEAGVCGRWSGRGRRARGPRRQRSGGGKALQPSGGRCQCRIVRVGLRTMSCRGGSAGRSVVAARTRWLGGGVPLNGLGELARRSSSERLMRRSTGPAGRGPGPDGVSRAGPAVGPRLHRGRLRPAGGPRAVAAEDALSWPSLGWWCQLPRHPPVGGGQPPTWVVPNIRVRRSTS